MKPYRARLFQTIKEKLLAKGTPVFVYFIRNGKYHYGELEIMDEKPYLKPDNHIKGLFQQVQRKKQEILRRISPNYRDNWKTSIERTEGALTVNNPIKLNWAASAIFGPLLIPDKSAQNYNVYLALYFRYEEIKYIIDPDKIRLREAALIEGKSYYTIEDVANSLFENNTPEPPQFIPTENEEINEYIRIKKADISNFINLNAFDISFSPEINLVVGDNNSGKTNLLKILYAGLKSLEDYNLQKKLYGRTYQAILSKKLQEVFQSANEGIGTIVSKGSQGELSATIDLSYLEEANTDAGNEQIAFAFGSTTRKEITEVQISELIQNEAPRDFHVFFIPVKEVLSIHQAIKSTFNQYIKGFDGTYFDLVNRIGPFISEDGLKPDFLQIAQYAEKEVMKGRIEFDSRENEFYFVNEGHKFEMTMTAEGFKQIGIIPALIRQGLLGPGSILFLDEPDNNLNPPVINQMLEMLKQLADAGVQIFLTSHNYFVLNRLHIMAKRHPNMDFRLFNLAKEEKKPATISSSDLKAALPENLQILQEALQLYNDDLETDLS